MTLFEQDQAHLRSRHAPERVDPGALEAVSPARIVIGVVRAGLAIALTAVRSRRDDDPISLRPRVLTV